MSSSDPTLVAEPGAVTDVAGRSVALHFGDAEAEYRVLQTGAALVDRSQRGRMRISGIKAAELVTGLVTNDVVALGAGHGLYAAALTPKGKIVADLRIFALGPEPASPRADGAGAPVESILVDVPSRATAGWVEI